MTRALRFMRLGVAGCALVVALTSCGVPSASAGGVATAAGRSTYTLMQMNVCLSGLAECYAKVSYPAAVAEAASLIQAGHPDAVTFSEACQGDVARIARQTGYHLRFSTVIYGGAPFTCVRPEGRGAFGDAVLTRAGIVSAENHPFPGETGIERRRWLCVTTRGGVDVCTAHLNTRSAVEVAGNDRQCAELAAVLARQPATRAVIFGGDVNRRPSCAPAGFWTRTDGSAHQDAGLQQAYGNGAFRFPSERVLPFAHSDHDVLVVRARVER